MKDRSRQVLVTGMHWSGTSAVGRLLAPGGGSPGHGEEVYGAGNEWVCQDFQDVNAQVMEQMGVYWNTATGGESERLSPADRNALTQQYREWVEGQDQSSSFWVVHDPCLSLTLPLVAPVLSNPIAVICHRHPLEVAQFLLDHLAVPLEVGMALWEIYTLSALDSSRNMPQVVVSHRRLVSDPVAATHDLFDRLEQAGAAHLERPSEDTARAIIEQTSIQENSEPRQSSKELTAGQAELHHALASGAKLDQWSLDRLSKQSRQTIISYCEQGVPDMEAGEACSAPGETLQVDAAEERIMEMNGNLRDASFRLDQISRRLEEEIALRPALADELQNVRSESREQLDRVCTSIDRHKRDAAGLLGAIRDRDFQYRVARGRLEQSREEIVRMIEQLESVTEERRRVSTLFQESQQKIAEMGAQNMVIEAERTRLTDSVRVLQESLADHEGLLRRHAEAMKEKEELRKALRNATERYRAVKTELTELRSTYEAFEARVWVRFYRSIQGLFGVRHQPPE